MIKLLEKLKAAADRIIAEKGSLTFFALWQPEDAIESSWEVVFSAKWADTHTGAAIHYVGGLLTESLTKRELVQIRRIAPLIDGAAIVARSLGLPPGEIRMREFVNFKYRDFPIRTAYVILLRAPRNRMAEALARMAK